MLFSFVTSNHGLLPFCTDVDIKGSITEASYSGQMNVLSWLKLDRFIHTAVWAVIKRREVQLSAKNQGAVSRYS